jgi:hypothetical protein
VVPRGLAHVLEIIVLSTRTNALLRCRCANVVPLLFPQEDIFELVHPGVGEEQRRIVGGNQRRALHDAMTLLLEVLQKSVANLVSSQMIVLTLFVILGEI